MKLKKAVKGALKGSFLEVSVQPGAKRNELSGFNEWRGRVEIKIKAEAKDNKANEELEHFLSEIFGCRVEIAKGKKSRQKTVFIPMKQEDVVGVLSRHITSK